MLTHLIDRSRLLDFFLIYKSVKKKINPDNLRLRSIILIYLWLIPAMRTRECLSQHSEWAVSDKPSRCKIDFSFGTPRSVSQTVMQ